MHSFLRPDRQLVGDHSVQVASELVVVEYRSVEVAFLQEGHIGVRDSKNPTGSALVFTLRALGVSSFPYPPQLP
ncbi:DUF397 domain-containing protein [Nocardia sp. NPDC051990]|uniref:DUF397 domain-containing protein n=1 Tax=Nocardia sp. NPDC051990 TaxID=3155285 RepID=UPI00341DA4FE